MTAALIITGLAVLANVAVMIMWMARVEADLRLLSERIRRIELEIGHRLPDG